MAVQAHTTAVVDTRSEIGSDVEIGPYAVIERDTVIGDRCRIGAHAVIKQYTSMGAGNIISEGAVLGGLPQDIKFPGGRSYLHIGEHNIFREVVTVNRATELEGVTRIGDGCFLMAYSHVAHECVLGNKAILANNVALAGHVTIGDCAFLSGGVVVHQFCRVGEQAMVGGNAKVVQDVVPFFLVDGVPAAHRSLNLVGIRRRGMPREDVQALKSAYRLLASCELRLGQKLEKLAGLESPLMTTLIGFIETSSRGLCSFSS